MAYSTRVIGQVPQHRYEYTGTEAEILAIAGPEGSEGIAYDTDRRWIYASGAWVCQEVGRFTTLSAANAAATSRIAAGSTPISPVQIGSGSAVLTAVWDPVTAGYIAIPFDGAGSGEYLIRFVDPFDGSTDDRWMDIGQTITPPAQVAHAGYVASGWGGASGANLIVSGDACFVGVYETADGWSHLDIVVNSITGLATTFLATKSDASELSVDWGDGSAIVTSSASGNITLSYTYATAGSYRVRVRITSGTGKWTPGNGTSTTPIFGNGMLWRLQAAVFNSDVVTIQTYGLSSQNGARYLIAPYVTSIADYGCQLWYSVRSLSVPSLGTIGVNGCEFHYCITQISLPQCVSIANAGYQGCYSAGFIYAPKLASAGNDSFASCNVVRSLYFPLLTVCGSGAFTSAYRCTSARFPSLLVIPASMLNEARTLESVDISAATSISSGALSSLRYIRSIAIPSTVTSIAASAFSANRSAYSYTFAATTPPTLAATNAFTSIPATCKIRVPSASLAAYQAATNWSAYAAYMEGY